jgi:ribonucleoside-diphosphate reductase alpha chain
VFDMVVPNPCTEFVHVPYSSCNLGSLNLLKFLKLKTNKKPGIGNYEFDFVKFRDGVERGTIYLNDIIDVNVFPVQKIEAVTKQVRPIGLGVMGLASALAMMGIPYGSAEGDRLSGQIIRYATLVSMQTSVELAKEKGPYPAYQQDQFMAANKRFFVTDYFLDIDINKLIEDIEKYGVRNSSFTSIAPTGSISTIASVSSGIEPIFALTYMRKVEKKNKEYDIMFITDKVFEAYLDYNFSSPEKFEILEKISKNNGSCQGIKEIPEKIQKIFKVAGDLSVDEHLSAMGHVARNTSLSVSKTINMPSTATVEDVANAYIKAHELGIIGVTVYRDGSREGILVHEKEEEYISERIAPKRPKSLPCDVYHIKVKGEDWVVFIGMYKGHPYEVFAGRVADTTLPRDITSGEIVKRGSKKYKFVYDNKTIINDITSIFDSGVEEALTRQISTNLRHGTPVKFIIEQLQKSKGTIVDFNISIIRALKKYLSNEASKEKCPVCGASLVYVDGCISCEDPQCGYSKCG